MREAREKMLRTLQPQLPEDLSALSDAEINGLISMAQRKMIEREERGERTLIRRRSVRR